MPDARRGVDVEAPAERIQAVGRARKALPRRAAGCRSCRARGRPAARPRRASSLLRNAMSKPALWITSRAGAGLASRSWSRNARKSSTTSANTGCVAQEGGGQAVHLLRVGRHVALGIEVAVEEAAGRHVVEQLERADLDHPVAVGRLEPGGLGIDHDLAHQVSRAPRRDPGLLAARTAPAKRLARLQRPAPRPGLARTARSRPDQRRDRADGMAPLQTGRDHEIGAPALLGVRQLARADRRQALAASCPAGAARAAPAGSRAR